MMTVCAPGPCIGQRSAQTLPAPADPREHRSRLTTPGTRVRAYRLESSSAGRTEMGFEVAAAHATGREQHREHGLGDRVPPPPSPARQVVPRGIGLRGGPERGTASCLNRPVSPAAAQRSHRPPLLLEVCASVAGPTSSPDAPPLPLCSRLRSRPDLRSRRPRLCGTPGR